MSENTTPKATDFAARAASEPTDLHKAFAEWIEANTGVKPDLKTVQIVCSMRMDFQKSAENQKTLEARRAEAAAKKAERDAKAKAKKLEQLKKLQAELGLVTAEGDPVADEAKELVADAVAKTESTPDEDKTARLAAAADAENKPADAKPAPKPRARRTPAARKATAKPTTK